MFDRVLDHSYGSEVRQRIAMLTMARLVANACFRFAPPFLATIAAGLGVSLDRIGVAVAISELSGLASPLVGALAERLQRRIAMSLGLAGVAAAAVLAATVPRLAAFAVALVVMGQSKALFDLGLASWISDRVPYERRGRVIGLTETAWALGLLVGVTALGLITAAISWRVAYLVAAGAVLVLAVVVRRVLAPDPGPDETHARPVSVGRFSLTSQLLVLAAGVFFLMAAVQSLFVTFGTWLHDVFGLSDTQLSMVVFGLGFCELTAALAAARFADRWGKERAASVGTGVMIPAALLLTVVHDQLVPGLLVLVVAIAAFEFAIVSAIPLGTEIVVGAPARGMAMMFSAGTLGRALSTVVATSLYQRHGIGWPAVQCAVMGCGTIVCMSVLVARRNKVVVVAAEQL